MSLYVTLPASPQGPGQGFFFAVTSQLPTAAVPPPRKRVIAFVDAQNLFLSAQEAFGYHYPDYDPKKLSEAVCGLHEWQLNKVYHYTGVPRQDENYFWHIYWTAKNRGLGRDPSIKVIKRDMKYRDKQIELPDPTSSKRDKTRFHLPNGLPVPPGTQLFLPDGKVVPGVFSYRIGVEKGIDVRIALDLVEMTRNSLFDVAVVFSQDQDLADAVNDAKSIAREQRRHIEVFSAYPHSNSSKNRDPIGGAQPILIDRMTYDKCRDPRDYRPRS